MPSRATNRLPPQPKDLDAKDAANKIVKAAASLLPAAAHLVDFVIKPSLERRKVEWFDDIGERLRRLEAEKRLTLDDLDGNEEFADAVLQATRAAISTRSEEKRRALRNAVINVALSTEPDDLERRIFLRLLEDFDESHLRVLKFFASPGVWLARFAPLSADQQSTRSRVLASAFPQLANPALAGKLWGDLVRAGLLNASESQLHNEVPVAAFAGGDASDAGRRFLAFIEEP